MSSAEPPRCVPFAELAEGDLAGLTRLLQRTWPGYYGPGGPGDAAADIAARCGRGGMPVGIAALRDGTPVGTATLAAAGFGVIPGDPPVLIGLAVDPRHRGGGVGTTLVRAVRDEAHRRGHPRILATVTRAAPLFRRLGWTPLRSVRDDAGTVWQVLESPAGQGTAT